MLGHHAANGSAHRAVSGQRPGPVHHGHWQSGLRDEGSQRNRSSIADTGKCTRTTYSIIK